MKKAVFFDRDGVIVRTIPVPGKHSRTPWTWDEFEILPGVPEGLAALKAAGYLRILVSNQPDVALGQMSEDIWQAMESKVEDLGFDDIYICRHHPRVSNCTCRKPSPKMIFDAAAKWNISLAGSFVIGDTKTDTDLALAVSSKSIIYDWPYNRHLESDYRVKSLTEILDII